MDESKAKEHSDERERQFSPQKVKSRDYIIWDYAFLDMVFCKTPMREVNGTITHHNENSTEGFV
jgi:hypothetical protein